MNVLITGVAGFIGSNLVERLLNKGHFVIGIDNFDILYDSRFKINNLSEALKNENFEFSSLDIREDTALKLIFSKHKIDVVVHLAARAGVRRSIQEPKIYEDINVMGTLNILNLCKEFSIKNLIFASSSSVYGNLDKVPFKENDFSDRPISPYAASKRAGELLCYTYSQLYNLPITCLRFFTVYGPRQRPDMAIHKFTRLIDEGKPITMYGDGSSSRDYTYIDDVVDAIVSLIKKPHSYEIINIGNGNQIKLKYLIELISKELQKNPIIKQMPIQQGDVNITYADITKAKELINYCPKITIKQGITKFVSWYKEKKAKKG